MNSLPRALEMIEDAAVVTAVTWLGCYVINVFRAPKLLDDEQAHAISGIETERDSALAQITSLKAASAIDPREQHRRDVVRPKAKQFAQGELGVLRYLLDHGKVRGERIADCGIDGPTIMSAISRGRRLGLIHDDLDRLGGPEVTYINPEFADALHFVLEDLGGS